jgi:hypothetical protein
VDNRVEVISQGRKVHDGLPPQLCIKGVGSKPEGATDARPVEHLAQEEHSLGQNLSLGGADIALEEAETGRGHRQAGGPKLVRLMCQLARPLRLMCHLVRP